MKYIVSFIICLLIVSAASADGGELKLSGTVRRVTIGGETPGWALVLDFDTALDGMIFREIELDPGDTAINQYKDRHVEITGTLSDRTSVERGKYTVLLVKSISKTE